MIVVKETGTPSSLLNTEATVNSPGYPAHTWNNTTSLTPLFQNSLAILLRQEWIWQTDLDGYNNKVWENSLVVIAIWFTWDAHRRKNWVGNPGMGLFHFTSFNRCQYKSFEYISVDSIVEINRERTSKMFGQNWINMFQIIPLETMKYAKRETNRCR